MNQSKNVPGLIMRGLHHLIDVSRVTVESAPRFISMEAAWQIMLRLTSTQSSKFVPKHTLWVLLIDSNYPYGRIRLYPALSNGIIHTFPHQDRNILSKKWRTGKPCLDSPSQRLGHIAGGLEPKVDPETRLRWHVERCLAWLDVAATEQLMMDAEPFELPQCPSEQFNNRFVVVHDEGPDTRLSWDGRAGCFGEVKWGVLPGFEKTIVAETFFDSQGGLIRTSCRGLSETKKLGVGYWWLWPGPMVIPPWHTPGTWGELRQICKRLDVDLDGFICWLSRRIAGEKEVIILVGYPIPTRWNGPITEVHWQAIIPPSVPAKIKPMNGFRDDNRGQCERLRRDIFRGTERLSYMKTLNFHPDRLQARGRFHATLRENSIAVVGAGALGSSVAELLIRGGICELLIIDHDVLEAGNLVRHTLTGTDLGLNKAASVASRLRAAAPMAKISSFEKLLPKGEELQTLLERFDIILDCTGDDGVICLLGEPWWSIPRIFLSASLGFAATRLFIFESWGHRFPADDFLEQVRPWLERERLKWSAAGEILEGAGCWSPLFPARSDDIWLASIATVKYLERALGGDRRAGFHVFEQQNNNSFGFQLLHRSDDDCSLASF